MVAVVVVLLLLLWWWWWIRGFVDDELRLQAASLSPFELCVGTHHSVNFEIPTIYAIPLNCKANPT